MLPPRAARPDPCGVGSKSSKPSAEAKRAVELLHESQDALMGRTAPPRATRFYACTGEFDEAFRLSIMC